MTSPPDTGSPSSSDATEALPKRATARQRRRARILAFQTLYEADLSGHPPGDVLQRLRGELRASAAAFDYARELLAGVVRHRREIDNWIARLASAWPIAQMSAVDRNLLRLGLFEALYNSTTIPVAVAINEAVELAKLYGSEASSRLVNGVLGRAVAEEHPASSENVEPRVKGRGTAFPGGRPDDLTTGRS